MEDQTPFAGTKPLNIGTACGGIVLRDHGSVVDGRLWLRALFGGLSSALMLGAFFGAAGRLDWAEGWAFLALLVTGQSVSALYIRRRQPGLLSRRSRPGKGTKVWDKAWLSVFALHYLAIMFVGALDSGRFGWSSMPTWLWGLGAALYMVSLVLVTRAMAANPFFEKTVRIQTELDHRVIDSGPYRFVRHPGYVGTILGFLLATPMLLGSWWAFLPAISAAAWLVLRTCIEDRTLRRELPGYADYARRVRYRLLPGVW
ncbi:MAG: methyltransferase family protein [Planctomycetota bacterium]